MEQGYFALFLQCIAMLNMQPWINMERLTMQKIIALESKTSNVPESWDPRGLADSMSIWKIACPLDPKGTYFVQFYSALRNGPYIFKIHYGSNVHNRLIRSVAACAQFHRVQWEKGIQVGIGRQTCALDVTQMVASFGKTEETLGRLEMNISLGLDCTFPEIVKRQAGMINQINHNWFPVLEARWGCSWTGSWQNW